MRMWLGQRLRRRANRLHELADRVEGVKHEARIEFPELEPEEALAALRAASERKAALRPMDDRN